MRGGGYSSQFLTRGEMPVTMCRLNLVKGQGPVLQIAEGWTVNLDKDVFKALSMNVLAVHGLPLSSLHV